MSNKLDLKLTVEEVNLIMESLGHLPYLRVYGLIENIQQQARGQLENTQDATASAAKQQEVKNGAATN